MNAALLYGDHVFETVRVVDGLPQRLQRHVERFELAAKTLGYPASEISHGTNALGSLRGREDGLWRVTFVRGADLLGDWAPDILFHHRPLPQRTRPRLTWVEGYLPNDVFAEFKTTSYLRSMMARRRAVALGYDDALMFSLDKLVGEASMANVFFVVEGALVTPSVEGLLPGTTRAAILHHASLDGVHIAQRRIQRDEADLATEIILTSSGLLAISALSINGRKLDEHWGPRLAEYACA